MPRRIHRRKPVLKSNLGCLYSRPTDEVDFIVPEKESEKHRCVCNGGRKL
jgi:hypothetical protein